MNEAIIIWLYLSLGNAVSVILGLTVIFGVCAPLGSLLYYVHCNRENEYKLLDFWTKQFPIKSLIFILVLCALYPTKDDLKYIIGGAVVWNGIEAAKDVEGIDRLPANLVNAANVFLESIEEPKE